MNTTALGRLLQNSEAKVFLLKNTSLAGKGYAFKQFLKELFYVQIRWLVKFSVDRIFHKRLLNQLSATLTVQSRCGLLHKLSTKLSKNLPPSNSHVWGWRWNRPTLRIPGRHLSIRQLSIHPLLCKRCKHHQWQIRKTKDQVQLL